MFSSVFKKLLETVCFGFILPSELLLFNIKLYLFIYLSFYLFICLFVLLAAAAGFYHDLYVAFYFCIQLVLF